jgi:hypothetical protein
MNKSKHIVLGRDAQSEEKLSRRAVMGYTGKPHNLSGWRTQNLKLGNCEC